MAAMTCYDYDFQPVMHSIPSSELKPSSVESRYNVCRNALHSWTRSFWGMGWWVKMEGRLENQIGFLLG